MPANKKYLSDSIIEKTVKISFGLIGGSIISALIHLVLAIWLFDHKKVLITSIFTFFLTWLLFFILPFLIKNIIKTVTLYTLLICIMGALVYYGKNQYLLI